jgi:IS30 family transposase
VVRLGFRSSTRARRWTPEDDALLQQLFEDRKPLDEIAAQMNRTIATVQRRTADLHSDRKRRRPLSRLWSRADDKLVDQLLREGRSLAVIARRLKRTHGAVRLRAGQLRCARQPGQPVELP